MGRCVSPPTPRPPPAAPSLHDIFHGRGPEASQLSMAFPTAVYINKLNECFLSIYAVCMSAAIQSAAGPHKRRIKRHSTHQSAHEWNHFCTNVWGNTFGGERECDVKSPKRACDGHLFISSKVLNWNRANYSAGCAKTKNVNVSMTLCHVTFCRASPHDVRMWWVRWKGRQTTVEEEHPVVDSCVSVRM